MHYFQFVFIIDQGLAATSVFNMHGTTGGAYSKMSEIRWGGGGGGARFDF